MPMDEHDESDGFDIRAMLTTDQRLADMNLVIDPGFVNHRLVQTVLGEPAITFINDGVAAIPDMPEGLRRGQIDHVYSRIVLTWVKAIEVPSLLEVLGAGRGRVFSGVIELESTEGVYKGTHVHTRVVTPGIDEPRVVLEYSPRHIGSDTTRMELARGGPMAVVAQFNRRQDGALVWHPLVMGAPWLLSNSADDPLNGAEWWSHDFFEILVEDFDDFARTRDVQRPSNIDVMAEVSEHAFKTCLAEILGEHTSKDWGGETSDHYSAAVHLRGKRHTAAFLLKGPAKFAPMGLNHLGKNNDQIVRLATEPADVLIVQHSHDITSPVRATLRAFAVRPERSRRYCLIDGRDSLRLLLAYDKLDHALALSK